MAFLPYYHQLAPVFYTSPYTMTLLTVRSWIVDLTPILGCSYHLYSSHHFLSTWGAVMVTNKIKKADDFTVKFSPSVYLTVVASLTGEMAARNFASR